MGRHKPSGVAGCTLHGMATPPNPDAAADAARRVLDTRIDVVRELATNRAMVDRIRHELAEAEQADAASFAECTRAGWTEAELKRIGFDPPKRRAPGRPRRIAANQLQHWCRARNNAGSARRPAASQRASRPPGDGQTSGGRLRSRGRCPFAAAVALAGAYGDRAPPPLCRAAAEEGTWRPSEHRLRSRSPKPEALHGGRGPSPGARCSRPRLLPSAAVPFVAVGIPAQARHSRARSAPTRSGNGGPALAGSFQPSRARPSFQAASLARCRLLRAVNGPFWRPSHPVRKHAPPTRPCRCPGTRPGSSPKHAKGLPLMAKARGRRSGSGPKHVAVSARRRRREPDAAWRSSPRGCQDPKEVPERLHRPSQSAVDGAQGLFPGMRKPPGSPTASGGFDVSGAARSG